MLLSLESCVFYGIIFRENSIEEFYLLPRVAIDELQYRLVSSLSASVYLIEQRYSCRLTIKGKTARGLD